MEATTNAGQMNPRARIDNHVKIVQEKLDNVEKRLEVIIKELLGPQPQLTLDDQMLKEEEEKVKASKIGGWLNQVASKLGDFSDQLRRIKKLEKVLEKSMIFSPKNATEERKEPTEGTILGQ